MSCRLAASWPLVLMLSMLAAESNAVGQEIRASSRGPRFLLAAWSGELERDASGAAVLRRRVSLALADVTIGHALKEITSQADLEISYSSLTVPLDRPVSLNAEDITVAAALTEILLDTAVDVSVTTSGQLALVKRAQSRPIAVDTGEVAGRVTDARGGSPLAGAGVTVEGTRSTATTDADGRYRIRLVSGNYIVRARYIGYAPASMPVAVVAEEEARVNFALEKSTQQLNQLVVTGTIVPTEVKALPTPINVISADEIAQRHPQALQDVIRQAVPTAVAFDNPVQPVLTSFSVRGVSSLSGSSPMKIFIDGVEATTFGRAPVDPSSVDRIEVVRGPQAATLYGSDAAGGVVQIFTKRGDPTLSRPHIDLQAAAGLAQTPYAGYRGVLRQEYTGSVRGGSGDVSYNFGGSYMRLGDYVPNGEESHQTSPSVYGGMQFARGMFAADLSARYYRSKLPVVNNPLLLTTGVVSLSRPNYRLADFTNETYGAQITLSPTTWWRHRVTLGVDRSRNSQVQTQPRLTTPSDTFFTVIDAPSRKVSIGYNMSVTRQFGTALGSSLILGVDHYDGEASNFTTTRALNTQGTILTSPAGSLSQSRSTINNTGYFAQVQLSWRDAVFLTGGVRAEENSTFGADLGTPVLPRIGLSVVHQVGSTTVKVRGSYGQGIRAASPGQTFGLVSPTQINLANPLLGPERQRGWDAGFDLVFGNRGTLSVTGYDQIAEDLIAFVQVATTPLPTFQFQNIGRATNRGIEVEATLTVQPLQLRTQYGYVRSRIEDLGPSVSPGAALQVGDRPDRIPVHTAGATLTVGPWGGSTLTAGVTYVGSWRWTDVLSQLRCAGGTGPCQANPRDYVINYPGYAKVNATVAQRVTRSVDAFLSVDNLTNKEAYEESNVVPVIGRVTMVGLHVGY